MKNCPVAITGFSALASRLQAHWQWYTEHTLGAIHQDNPDSSTMWDGSNSGNHESHIITFLNNLLGWDIAPLNDWGTPPCMQNPGVHKQPMAVDAIRAGQIVHTVMIKNKKRDHAASMMQCKVLYHVKTQQYVAILREEQWLCRSHYIQYNEKADRTPSGYSLNKRSRDKWEFMSLDQPQRFFCSVLIEQGSTFKQPHLADQEWLSGHDISVLSWQLLHWPSSRSDFMHS